jgi:hypothetical protein
MTHPTLSKPRRATLPPPSKAAITTEDTTGEAVRLPLPHPPPLSIMSDSNPQLVEAPRRTLKNPFIRRAYCASRRPVRIQCTARTCRNNRCSNKIPSLQYTSRRIRCINPPHRTTRLLRQQRPPPRLKIPSTLLVVVVYHQWRRLKVHLTLCEATAEHHKGDHQIRRQNHPHL